MSDTHARVPTAPKEGWTAETLLDHVLGLISANDRRYEERFATAQRAVEVAKSATDVALGHLQKIIDVNDTKYGTRFESMEKSTLAALQSADRAVTKAETAAEKRFEGVNEFRNTLSDQQRNLMPRSEVAVMIAGLSDKIAAVEKTLDALLAERQGVKGGWGYAVGLIGFVLTVASLIALVMRQNG